MISYQLPRIPFARFSRAAAWHGVVVLLAVGAIWAGIGVLLVQQRAGAKLEAGRDARNFSHAFAETISRTIEGIDQTILLVRQAYATDPEHFNLATWARGTQFLNARTPEISIADKDGVLSMTNLGSLPSRIDLSDREHVAAQLHNDTDELFISRPVVGRMTGKWSVKFTRKLLAPDGSLAGWSSYRLISTICPGSTGQSTWATARSRCWARTATSGQAHPTKRRRWAGASTARF